MRLPLVATDNKWQFDIEAAAETVAEEREAVADEIDVTEVALEQEPELQAERRRLVSQMGEERAAVVVEMNVWRAEAFVKPVEKQVQIVLNEREEEDKDVAMAAFKQEPEYLVAEPTAYCKMRVKNVA
ncbi:hypothetical protein HOY80DRAFT_1032543 [Tuber brumale]|nr:hypothetical protein HOY80DRAFT_1032543 [Tuber brumale]